jgi:ribosomal protein S18 acetylase RimI-like enzyme
VPDFEIRIVDVARPEDVAALEHEVNEYNFAVTGYRDGRSLSCFLRDGDGNLVAGIDGFTWGGYAHIEFLWVHADHRGRGLGQGLVAAAEVEATARGCRSIVVSSHEFQAPDLYRRLGYQDIGASVDTPIGARHFFFQKMLTGSAPTTA